MVAKATGATCLGGHGACDGRRRSPRTAPLGGADPHADRGCELVGPQRSERWPPRERSGRQLQKTHGHACPAPVTGLTLRGPRQGPRGLGSPRSEPVSCWGPRCRSESPRGSSQGMRTEQAGVGERPSESRSRCGGGAGRAAGALTARCRALSLSQGIWIMDELGMSGGRGVCVRVCVCAGAAGPGRKGHQERAWTGPKAGGR